MLKLVWCEQAFWPRIMYAPVRRDLMIQAFAVTSAEQLEYANKDLAIIAAARDALDIDLPPTIVHTRCYFPPLACRSTSVRRTVLRALES